MTAEADEFKELLNRESRAAHESLIEPTPRSTLSTARREVSSEQQNPNSPTTSQLKTRRSRTSVETPKTKKPLKTYGKRSQDTFEFHGGSDGELDIKAMIDPGHEAKRRKKNESSKVNEVASRQASQSRDVTRRPITSSGGDTELLSTEPRSHEIYLACGKDVSPQSSMPPPASKNTSFEQAQRSIYSVSTTMTELTPYKPSASSILPPLEAAYVETHSDDHTPNFTWSPRGEDSDENCRGLFENGKLNPLPSFEQSKTVDLQPTVQATEESAPALSASGFSPSKTITVKKIRTTNAMSQELSSHLHSEYLQPHLRSKTPTKPSPAVLLPTPADVVGCHNELSLSIPGKVSKCPTGPTNAPNRKRVYDEGPLDELGSEDDAIGIPKEQYQPRPSKRRSGDGDEEIIVPIDFSKKPEAMGKSKRKTKRHKTTAFQELLPKVEDEEEEIKVAPDPRFDIPGQKPSKVSGDRDQPDRGQDDNTEETRPEDRPEPKQEAKVPGQKKRGRPKKAVTNVAEETVLEEAEADHDQDDAEIDQPFISTTAKESRGRSKTKEITTPIVDELDRNNDVGRAAGDDPGHPSIVILNETHGNVVPPKLAEKPLPDKIPVAADIPPETPRKSTTPAQKGPDKHSPISSGNVAYRVGLSKRARIAPLLRIVRK